MLGMHRSGTSLVAGILHALGVNMGTTAGGERWEGKHWSNPTGHFENPAFVELDQRILGGDATGIRGAPHWQDLDRRGGSFAEEIDRLLAASRAPLWGWKDPWTVLTLPLFLPKLTAPHFIIVRRPKDEVIGSLRKRSSMHDEEIGSLYDLYEARLAEYERRLPPLPVLSVHYHEVLEQPRAAIDRLIGFLALRPTREELERAFGMVLNGPALRAESRRIARTGLLEFPRWAGWIVKRDLRVNPRVIAEDVGSAIPRELVQVLRALL